MKRALLAASVLLLLIGTGCQTVNKCNTCKSCRSGHGGIRSANGGIGSRHAGARSAHGGTRKMAPHAGRVGPGVNPDFVAKMRHNEYHEAHHGAAGPPTAAVAYPYYTTRGPRDFLNPNPPTIGY